MAKGDRDLYRDGQKLPARFSDASAALRGFAQSELTSSIVFSAGLNPRLYSYAAEFADFLPDPEGRLKKKIVLKVSDFHSAAVQGKFLAKRGLWVSEYRVESGLNCGGHAFATKGLLLGPILREFQEKRDELIAQLHATYSKALLGHDRRSARRRSRFASRPKAASGLRRRICCSRDLYGLDGTGWGTPFLLCPRSPMSTTSTCRSFAHASNGDVYLSDSSPFGLPFWNLRTSASEETRRRRIAENQPGSPCSKGFASCSTPNSRATPICVASREYQKLKLAQLDGIGTSRSAAGGTPRSGVGQVLHLP